MTDLSYQLYSSREGAGPAETLQMLADAGYTQVEGFGPYYENPEETAQMLNQAGLAMTSGHMALEEVEADPAKVIALARTLGIKRIYAPYLDASQRPSDKAGWAAFGKRVDEAGKPLRDAGLIYGWHNHDFEMVDLGGGETALDLIAGASPDLRLELDLGWVHRAGQDCIATIRKFGSQIESLHIKDAAPEGENPDQDGWATVGQGVMDWPAILSAARNAGISHFVVENDQPVDDADFARGSAAYLKSLPEVSA